ncbi:MAG: hypothetical protein WBC06_03300 [Chitinophagaceae bacterium]
MKKIKRIQDIEQEKMRLRIRELELEKELRKNWKEVRHDLQPSNFIKKKLSEYAPKKEVTGQLFSDAISAGAGYVSRKITELAGHKVEIRVQEEVEKLAEKIKSVFGLEK